MILFNFDVIAKPDKSIGQRQPDVNGRHLWSMFHEKEMGRLCLIINEECKKEHLEVWLKREGFKASMYEFVDIDNPVLKAERIHTIASMWGRIKWYVDNDPRVCAETIKLGIPTLLVGVPFVVRPEWSEPANIREWESVVEELDRQAMKASMKTWDEL